MPGLLAAIDITKIAMGLPVPLPTPSPPPPLFIQRVLFHEFHYNLVIVKVCTCGIQNYNDILFLWYQVSS